MQDKVWVNGPDLPREIYTVLADAGVMHPTEVACCTPAEAQPDPVLVPFGVRTPAADTCC